jgi:hypothetical protein
VILFNLYKLVYSSLANNSPVIDFLKKDSFVINRGSGCLTTTYCSKSKYIQYRFILFSGLVNEFKAKYHTLIRHFSNFEYEIESLKI